MGGACKLSKGAGQETRGYVSEKMQEEEGGGYCEVASF